MEPTVSVVIPVHDAADQLEICLAHLDHSGQSPFECLVVDDGSHDDLGSVAARHGAKILSLPHRSGPARARNLGARTARGNVVLFLDADVCAPPETIGKITAAFASDPSLDALIGSYDDAPSSPGFFSQYKNLLHCFVHRNARHEASTFWSGCGAIRREVFLEAGGFDASYDRPAIEDIELGYRLAQKGRKTRLDPSLTVKHLKRWTFLSLVRCDIFDRGVPWTELIWRDQRMPDDLNLRVSQRASVALVSLLMLLTLTTLLAWGVDRTALPGLTGGALLLFWLGGTSTVVAMNHRLFRFFARCRGSAFALAAIPMHLLYFFYSGIAFGMGTFLFATRALDARVARVARVAIDELEPEKEKTTAIEPL